MNKKNELNEIVTTGWKCFRSAMCHEPRLYSTLIAIDIVRTLLAFVQIIALGFIIDELINVVQRGGDTNQLYVYIAIYTASLVVPTLVSKIYSYVEVFFYRRFSDKMSIEYVSKVASRDIQIIEDGDFQNRRAKAREQGVYQLYIVAEQVGMLTARLLSIVIAIAYLGTLDWRFAVLGLFAALPALLIEYFHGQRVYGAWDEDTHDRRLSDERRNQLHTKKDLVELRLFLNVQYFIDLVWNYMVVFQKKMLEKERYRMRDEMIGVFMGLVTFAAALYLITDQVVVGLISVGGLTVALGAYARLEGDLSTLFSMFGAFTKGARYAKEYYAVMETPNVLLLPEKPVKIERGAPIIEFKNVWFKYPGSETWVFENLNLTIDAGTKVALVGHNGAGKTTFVHLLLRIYDPTKGQITVNGVDLKDADLDSYYQNSAALMQEFAVFKFKTGESIALGDTSIPYDNDRMLAAAHASHAYSFIERWDEGYDAMIGREFDGKELSGGERQRMAIARVFYRDAGLVILDEPTSAVDAIAEQEIFESVYNSGKQQTILTISHRFSTVKKSDIIVVLEHGSVVEMGSHADLIAKQGRYNELYTAQASAYND